MPPTGPQLVHAIRRNFGGLEESGVDPEKIFFDKLPRNIDEAPDLTNIDPAVKIFNSVILLCYGMPMKSRFIAC